MAELSRDPPAWLSASRESRTYFRAADDWEFYLSRAGDRGARVSVPLRRDDQPVYPAAAKWLTTVMKDIDGSKRTWFGDFDFPVEHLRKVERALAASLFLSARAVELVERKSDVGEFLGARPDDILEESYTWDLVLDDGKRVQLRLRGARGNTYEVSCSRDGVLWDGKKKKDWPRQLVGPASWLDFRKAVLASSRERPSRESIDAFIASLATGDRVSLKKFAGSWKTAEAKWRYR